MGEELPVSIFDYKDDACAKQLKFTIDSGDSWMYPGPNVPLWEIPIKALYHVGIYGI